MVKRAEENSTVLARKLDTQAKLLEKVKDSAKSSSSQPKLKFSGGNTLPPNIVKMLAKKKAKVIRL